MVQIQSNLEHFVGQYLQFSPSSQYQPCLNDVRRFLRKTPRQAEIVPKNQASLLTLLTKQTWRQNLKKA